MTIFDLAEVSALTLGNGSNTTQRSSVTRVAVTFGGLVEVNADAFELQKNGTDGGLVTAAFTLATDSQNNSVASRMFSGAFMRNGIGAWVDGNYQLTTDPTKVRRAGTSVELDGNGDGRGCRRGYGRATGVSVKDTFAAFNSSMSAAGLSLVFQINYMHREIPRSWARHVAHCTR